MMAPVRQELPSGTVTFLFTDVEGSATADRAKALNAAADMAIGHGDAAAARLLPMEVGLAAAAIPIRVGTDGVQVGFGDPTDDQALDAVTEHLPRISIAVAEVSEIKRAWQSLARH